MKTEKNNYQFMDGRKMVHPEIVEVNIANLKEEEELFKVNLPDSPESFERGSGEGVWAITDKDSYQILQKDGEGELLFVRILNNSVYFPGLLSGDIVPVETRGDSRPIAFYEELSARFPKSDKEKILQQIYNNNSH